MSVLPGRRAGTAGDFVAGLQAIYHNPDGDHAISSMYFDEYNMPLARMMLESFLEQPGQGLLNRDTVLLRAAEKLTGSMKTAEQLVGIWADMKLADLAMYNIPQKGANLLTPWTTVSARWLVRPLVPQPDQLTRKKPRIIAPTCSV